MGTTFFIVMVLLGVILFWVAYIADGKKNAGVHVICGTVIGVVMGMNTMYCAEKDAENYRYSIGLLDSDMQYYKDYRPPDI